MKKLLLAVAAITIFAASVNAQGPGKPGLKFSIAGNVGSGTTQYYKLSAGADIQAGLNVTTGLDLTGSVGYQNFAYEIPISSTAFRKDHISFIPVLLGAKVPFGKGLYGHGQLGYAFLTKKNPAPNSNNGDFAFAPSLGYGFGKNWDLAVKYLSIDKVNAILARLAYNF
ncbi:MAG TPA: hypothetical protein VGP43_02010 [Chitinophagaceae bacterium]|nr:hypothetical protein [Chitinophagaceae bacterium]